MSHKDHSPPSHAADQAKELEAHDDDRGLLGRSVRTLAWLGDVEWERELRLRLIRTGDWPTDRLDSARARLARSDFQAQVLANIQAQLDETELRVVSRGRNTSVRSRGRVDRDVRSYRSATALEALVAYWRLAGTWSRFEQLVVPELERGIAHAITHAAKPRRG